MGSIIIGFIGYGFALFLFYLMFGAILMLGGADYPAELKDKYTPEHLAVGNIVVIVILFALSLFVAGVTHWMLG